MVVNKRVSKDFLFTGKHHPFVVDISSSASVSTLMSEVKEKYSTVPTIAVNSAGITKDTFMLKMKEEMWDEVINVNLKVRGFIEQVD